MCVKVCGFGQDVAVEATSLDTLFPQCEISLIWAPLIKAFEAVARSWVAFGCSTIKAQYDGKYELSNWPSFHRDCKKYFEEKIDHARFSGNIERLAGVINDNWNQHETINDSPVLNVDSRSSGVLGLALALDPQGLSCTAIVTATIELYVDYDFKTSVYLTPQALKATGTVNFTRRGNDGTDGWSIASSENSGTADCGTSPDDSTMPPEYQASTAAAPVQSQSDGSENDEKFSVSIV